MAPKRRLRAVRADDNDDDDNLDVCHARTLNISKDGRRTVRSAVSACARVECVGVNTAQWIPPLPAPHNPNAPPRRYVNSDSNMLKWVSDGRQQEFLEELVRHEGPGVAGPVSCVSCRDPRLPGSTVANEGIFRCEECWSIAGECLDCLLRGHQRNPLHNILRWNGDFYEKVTLFSLGLRMQLGHRAHLACHNPVPANKDFTIMHTNGLHKVAADWCGCETRTPRRIQLLRSELYPATTRNPKTAATFRLLEEHEMLTASGKLSPYEHYQALERLTDNTAIELPKRRYKSLLRINRQFGSLKMMKRAGRGSVNNGHATTKSGELAIPCPACPRVGVNLPPNWKSSSPDERFLYRPIFSLDANFRLKNLRRPKSHDPGLHTGLAYFVERDPYLEYIGKHPGQKDISSCSGFKTLAQAETKSSAGLRSTGVGMCTCARHEIIFPNGVGDLQLGEKFCNMDYIALSAARHHHGFDELFFCYDIACQWCIHLRTRMDGLPEYLKLPDEIRLDFAVPKCHCRGHKLSCQCQFSMNVQVGVGRTDGEGIERTWNGLNNSAPMTKEMLPGGRADVLDRRCAAHNWGKTIEIGHHLHRKENEATSGAHLHTSLHAEFTKILPPESITQWTAEVVLWEKDHTRPNPFFVEAAHDNEVAVKNELAAEERKAARTVPQLHETSASACLSFGLWLEEEMRHITYLLQCEEKDSPAVVKEIQDKRALVEEQLPQFRSMQQVYMPCIAPLLVAVSAARDNDVEKEPLFFPSVLSAAVRIHGCLDAIPTKEEKLREAQCHTALETVRRMQRAYRTVTAFRHRNIRGTKSSGRSFDILKRLTAKSDLAVLKYQAARVALLALRGNGQWETVLRPLLPSDVKALSSYIFDIDLPKTKKKKTGIKPNDVMFGSGSYQIPWIWLMEGAIGTEDKDELNASIRVEWLKSRARAMRWTEEERLVPVEKQRVLDSFEFTAVQWETRIEGWEGISAEVFVAVRALGLRQADLYRRLAAHCRSIWLRPPRRVNRRIRERVEVQEVEDSESEDEEVQEAADAEEIQEAVEALEEGLAVED